MAKFIKVVQTCMIRISCICAYVLLWWTRINGQSSVNDFQTVLNFDCMLRTFFCASITITGSLACENSSQTTWHCISTSMIWSSLTWDSGENYHFRARINIHIKLLPAPRVFRTCSGSPQTIHMYSHISTLVLSLLSCIHVQHKSGASSLRDNGLPWINHHP